MSKATTTIAILLLAVTALAAWAIFFVENDRKNLEVRQFEAQRRTVLENEEYSAWKHATRYDTFWSELTSSGQEPKRSDTYTERHVWVKAFQRADVKPVGISKK